MLTLYREDLEKHKKGSPCHIAQMTFYVARIGTKESISEFKEIREKLYGIFPKSGEINENKVFANWLAYYGVVGWENVTDDENDEPMEYTKDSCRQLFLTESYWLSLNQALITHATNFECYLHDQAYDDVEKLKKK